MTRLAVIVPTYERAQSIARLLSALARQTVDPARFEVVIVDDGSTVDPTPTIAALDLPYRHVVVRQENAGAAAARDRGVRETDADVILFVDDDMEPVPALLAEHLAVHDAHPHAVVLGRILPDEHLRTMPLWERFHASVLERFYDALRAGEKPHGTNVCTGNVSMRRADYLAVGGFDPELKRSEDAELGIKLQELGAEFFFRDGAATIHHSDHGDANVWLRRAHLYGVYEVRIGRKHREPWASPWRFLDTVGITRPFFAFSLIAPSVSKHAARGLFTAARALDRLHVERPAVAATSIVYGMEYCRGAREELGSLATVVLDHRAYQRAQKGTIMSFADHVERFVSLVKSDYAALTNSKTKYGSESKPKSLPRELVERIGFQITTGYRVMRLFQESGHPLAAKITSRLMRHLYASDLHWEADIGPGFVLAHGFATGIAGPVKIGANCIMTHSVSIGMGIDPVTRKTGAPVIEDDVHIGPGAVVLGPIRIGKGSKIAPSTLVTCDVPPYSVVEPAPARIVPRARKSEKEDHKPSRDAPQPEARR